jgi:hypothetical protein
MRRIIRETGALQNAITSQKLKAQPFALAFTRIRTLCERGGQRSERAWPEAIAMCADRADDRFCGRGL